MFLFFFLVTSAISHSFDEVRGMRTRSHAFEFAPADSFQFSTQCLSRRLIILTMNYISVSTAYSAGAEIGDTV